MTDQIVPPMLVRSMERTLLFCLLPQLAKLQGLESPLFPLSNLALTEIDQRRQWFYRCKLSDA